MFKAYGLYSHIRANQLRTMFLLAGFVVLLVALMFSISLLFEALSADAPLEVLLARAVADVKQGWPFALGGAALWFCIAFLFHQRMIDYATGSAGISRKEAPRLYNLLENLCISRGIPIPALKIIDDEALNAFASGLREGHYSVSVTRGLLARLDDAEIEAVLGHELTHIRNRDTQVMVVATIFAGIFAFVGDLMFRSWNFPFGFSPRRDNSREERGGGGGAIFAIVIALLVIALSWGASVLIRLAISRAREFLADAGSVELTKNPDAMISALRKIEAQAAMRQIPSRMQAFFIESPALQPESGVFATHPSVDERVAALVEFAGGRDLPLGPTPQEAGKDAPGGFLPPDVQSSAAPRERGPWG
ncbi:M48 family metallopeptidase [Methylocystis bryophila]|uniref:Peptidase M48 n=1 Tax=Methylocystis bryophila TaxID=655015 RepID=A0A1W6MQ87_9HYPH|nr:M48 family metallopeptidase [Methylocystis bryophila]ARN79747.1 peptidase M48 [Methylocystis bryophila]BDV39622.1 protease HtpX [Methylocystis bryophila]